jgi:hypothetical protein
MPSYSSHGMTARGIPALAAGQQYKSWDVSNEPNPDKWPRRCNYLLTGSGETILDILGRKKP